MLQMESMYVISIVYLTLVLLWGRGESPHNISVCHENCNFGHTFSGKNAAATLLGSLDMLKMASPEVLRDEIWVIYSLDFDVGYLGGSTVYRSFVVDHTTIKSHQLINELLQSILL